VICARLNKKEAILKAFPRRLENSTAEEMDSALKEIFKIADLRLKDLVE
jgi:2-oxo-4-hydroxy-4-carboxy-5-ureidoimidazoline decarboxylase